MRSSIIGMHNTMYKNNLKRLGSLASHGENHENHSHMIHGGEMNFNPIPFDLTERNSELIEENRRSTMLIK